MELINATYSGRFSRRVLNGRSYLVVPAVGIVPGVLNGSRGALYYPPSEIVKSVHAWNNMPVTIGHPVENGIPVTARRPDVAERYQIGTVYHAGYDDKLTLQAWIDEDLCRNKAPEVLRSIYQNKALELSTGLKTDDEAAPTGSIYNGKTGAKPYTRIARNYGPDHLAILPNQRGACSLDDGCGLGVNAEGDTVNDEQTSVAHECTGPDCPTCAENVGGDFRKKVSSPVTAENGESGDVTPGFLLRLFDKVLNTFSQQPRSTVTGRIKRPNAGVGAGDVHEAAQFGGLSLTEEDRKLGQDLAINPAWVQDEDLWEKAKAASDKAGHAEDWPYVAGIYKRMGGRVTPPVENEEIEPVTNQNPEETIMPTRKDHVTYLVTNCECYKGKESVLNDAKLFTDPEVEKLRTNHEKNVQNSLVVNALVTKLGDKAPALNEMPAFIQEKIDAKKEDAKDGGKDDSDENPDGTKKKKPVENREKPLTERLTPDELRVWNAMKLNEQRETSSLVEKLVANVKDPKAKAVLVANYSKQDRDFLELAVKSLPTPTENRGSGISAHDNPSLYLGAGGPPTVTNALNDDTDDLLDLPTMNWEVIDKHGKVVKAVA